MKHAAIALALAIAASFGIDALADRTQDRADRHPAGRYSDLIVRVSTRGARTPPPVAAMGLWGACQGTVPSRLVDGPLALGENRFRLRLRPALGEHAKRRLHGCLEDATIDRVQAKVLEVRSIP